MAFNADATMLATASVKGTVVRVFSIPSGELLFSLRRGSSSANIYSIAFNKDSSILAVSSDKGTVHLFKLVVDPYEKLAFHTDHIIFSKKQKPASGGLTDAISNMFDSIRDFAHAKIQTKSSELRNIVQFSPTSDAVIVATFDGFLYRFSFDRQQQAGECVLDSQKSISEVAAEMDGEEK